MERKEDVSEDFECHSERYGVTYISGIDFVGERDHEILDSTQIAFSKVSLTGS